MRKQAEKDEKKRLKLQQKEEKKRQKLDKKNEKIAKQEEKRRRKRRRSQLPLPTLRLQKMTFFQMVPHSIERMVWIPFPVKARAGARHEKVTSQIAGSSAAGQL